MTTFNVYRRNTVSDTPLAIATGLTSKSYSDTTATKGNTYLYSVGAVKNGIEKISAEISKSAGDLWTPANLSALPKIWINAKNVVESSGLVSSMTNLGSSGINFTQSNNSYKPALSSQSVTFDGVNDRLLYSDRTLGKSISSVWSLFVFYAVPTASQQCVFLVPIGTNNAARFSVNITTLGTISVNVRRLDSDAYFGHSTGFSIQSGMNILLVKHDYSTATVTVRLNGVESSGTAQTAGTTSNTNSYSDIALGFDPGNTRYFSGKIYESLIQINNLIDTELMQKLEGWAAHKYGLIDSLPLDHPYKTLVPTI